jgi:cytosine/adenosine deaminase-related metal-dependent hydrolase
MIIISRKLLFAHQDAPPINNGALVFSKGAIIAVDSAEKILVKYPGHRVARLENAVIMPGLINVHTHLELPPLLNVIRARTFPEWVLNLIHAKRNLDLAVYTIAAKENVRSLIRCGTTCVGEICSHDVSPAILKQSGLRAVVYKELITMAPLCTMKYLSSLLSRPSVLIQYGISPHTPYTVSESALLAIKQLSQKKFFPLAMHIGESKDEIRLFQRKKSGLQQLYRLAGWDLSGAPSASSSFEYLQRIGFLSHNLLAVHAVHIKDGDIAIMKKSKVSVAHCPRSNKETGVGRMPLKKLLDKGIFVGLGTDSLTSSPSLNLWDEMRYAFKIHQRDGITAKDIFKLVTVDGSKALRMEKETGSLEPGKRADIIAVPLPQKDTGDLYSDLLRETKSCIMSVVNGKVLYQEQ